MATDKEQEDSHLYEINMQKDNKHRPKQMSSYLGQQILQPDKASHVIVLAGRLLSS